MRFPFGAQLHELSSVLPQLNRLSLLLAALMTWFCTAAAAEQPRAVEMAALHNVFQVTESIYSGNSPDSEEGFRELQKLGVKTIISVDGSKPNLTLAHKYGMINVHLPIGYDGVPHARAVELTKVGQTAAGPLYVHCHHGKHRGPAAAAVVCRATKGWTVEKADEFLKQAGTSPDYAGLYRDVRAFRQPTAEELTRIPNELPEVANTPDLVNIMVAIDEYFDTFKAAQKDDWRELPAQPAMLLWELLREHARDPETVKRGDDYKARLADSERAADALRLILRDPNGTSPGRDAALLSAGKTCGACHKAHRN